MKFQYWSHAASVAIGALVIAINFLFISEAIPFLFPILNVAGGLVAAVPLVLVLYSRYKTSREIEQQFIVFIRDLGDSINSGMSLPLALTHTSKNDYASLNTFVKDLAAQVDWGIPFKRALETFSRKIGSISVRRAITTLIETYKAGGKIADTLEAINKSLVTVEKIKRERSSAVHSQIVTSYMIFFVFIFILVILQSFLIPSLTSRSVSTAALAITQAPENLPTPEAYANTFTIFIIIQGFFAGIVTGKMAEGSMASGFKHSIILIVIGYLVFSMASQLHFSF